MIIPVIFTLDPICENLSQTWVFYKAVSFCKQYRWPVIAQQQYFEEWEKQHRVVPQFFRDEICQMFEYMEPKKSDLMQIHPISIPHTIEQELIRKVGTQSDAYMYTFRENWEELEDFLCDKIRKAERLCGEKAEALTCLTYVKFLENVSKRLGIPTIYYEWGPFRYSSYRNTAYFDIDGQYKNIHQLYQQFKEQSDSHKVFALKEKEILALFLNDDHLNYLEMNENTFESYDKYEMGVAPSYHSLTETNSYTYLNMVELYNKAIDKFGEDAVAVRYHPGDPIHARLNVKNEIGGELIEFLLSCKRVACISSNVEMEAMLYGKKVYDEGRFKYQGFINKSILALDDRQVTTEEINFIVFVILCPFELLNSVEYIRFRLQCHDLHEIYMYHLNYYLDCYQISLEELRREPKQRLDIILKARKFELNHEDFEPEKYDSETGERTLNIMLRRQIRAYKAVEKKYTNKLSETERLARELSDKQEELNNVDREKQLLESEKERILWEKQKLEQDYAKTAEELERSKQIVSEYEIVREQQRAMANELEQLQTAYHTVLNSTSMKITKPLRKLAGMLRGNGE